MRAKEQLRGLRAAATRAENEANRNSQNVLLRQEAERLRAKANEVEAIANGSSPEK